jgi:hypothetical protein
MNPQFSPRQKWWLCFLFSVTLPIWAIGGLLTLGGWFIDELPFSIYQWFNLSSFLLALGLTVFLLRRPHPHKILRVFSGLVLGVVFLAGAALSTVSSSCGPTTMKLGRAFSKEPRRLSAVGGCDSIALTTQSTRTR